ncbi:MULTISPECIES: ATP-binding cassette domain-containing protein [Bifidobacterium]|uniref:ATP-binding protein of ABC transporter system n=1 Tax=Bifidobacterium reuteri DSM 23975 TaxID=1437610 RepID=A0A087CME1_9BIFI|nr:MULTISPECIES: ATP-binding cassette domain-containing protein [Bifidobacterium]KFI84441.1 ATP-binding protein of ABC transporter system [Bifidobacterium reuteri DSM 23975]TPF77979.1 ABC transporter ATP-binding protein [Bifidobacterium sp. UTCIF-1]TPF80200.1 ABC transporter ATP-binding protein [Bifidobacterium sp. UTCIF-24]TPF83006.1 ABC transporter ATP-binding protein [Bifidobacterium sp. UTCIF-3]TPF83913.1 ABC transporter ATP-binding protein [Bifidobacterium sp. UTCIF-36]
MSEKNTSENTSEELEQDGELKAQGDDNRSPADFIQFSVTFDDEDDDTEDTDGAVGTEGAAANDIYSSLAAAENAADTADACDSAESVADANTADAAESQANNRSEEAVANTAAAAGDAEAADGREPSEAEADALASANASAEVTARNAARVNETLGLAKSEKRSTLVDHEDASHKAEPTMTLASRIDRVLVGGGADDVLLKTYPTFALNKVTLAGAKGRVNVLDDVEFACYAGHSYALLVSDDTDAGITADLKRRALMGVMTGLVQPTSGAVMNKSANIAELEPIELRGHRLGIVPQLHAVQPYLDAEHNVLYAMDASNRNFLKPRPVIARELLAKVGFSEATTGMAVGKMPLVQQRLVAIARAISTEAEVLILDEPTRGLNDDDTVAVFAALAKLAHSGDPKHCVIVLTASREIAEAADTLFEV